ncbi:hypothetical protein L873DRAFT_1802612 [Choiromyces venosus 120613-1]|uniref:Uncharacterized protein n=1 Tax=Choiromyces venosus 120613-1 TaxID=1336337 RepID=A0A3N4JV11_9PEZI|nr:hypothetical protein L873DRAFT_1802612 [Choiromyces venosus 120613-1]
MIVFDTQLRPLILMVKKFPKRFVNKIFYFLKGVTYWIYILTIRYDGILVLIPPPTYDIHTQALFNH